MGSGSPEVVGSPNTAGSAKSGVLHHYALLFHRVAGARRGGHAEIIAGKAGDPDIEVFAVVPGIGATGTVVLGVGCGVADGKALAGSSLHPYNTAGGLIAGCSLRQAEVNAAVANKGLPYGGHLGNIRVQGVIIAVQYIYLCGYLRICYQRGVIQHYMYHHGNSYCLRDRFHAGAELLPLLAQHHPGFIIRYNFLKGRNFFYPLLQCFGGAAFALSDGCGAVKKGNQGKEIVTQKGKFWFEDTRKSPSAMRICLTQDYVDYTDYFDFILKIWLNVK